MRGVDVHTAARLDDVHDDKPDSERDCRCNFEVDDRLDADAAGLMKVCHAGNADHNGCKNDRSEQHPDQFDEQVSEWFELRTEVRVEMPDEDAGNNANQNLYVELGKRFSDL